jgi:hypothetical protein
MSQIKENFAAQHDVPLAGESIELPLNSSQNFKVSMLFVDFMICMIAGGYLLLISGVVGDVLDLAEDSAKAIPGTSGQSLLSLITGKVENTLSLATDKSSPIRIILGGLLGGMGRKAPGITGILLLTTGLHSLFLYNRVTQGHHPLVPEKGNKNEELQAGHHPTLQEINRHLTLRIAITAFLMITNGLTPFFGSMAKKEGGAFKNLFGIGGLTSLSTIAHFSLLVAAINVNNHDDENLKAPQGEDADGNPLGFCDKSALPVQEVNRIVEGKVVNTKVKLDKVHGGVYICNGRNL